jgi:hypothetical protein
MLENLPIYISITFGITTLVTLLLLVWTVKKSPVVSTQKLALPIFIALSLWLVIQAFITLKGVYHTNTQSFPPKIVLLGVLPMLILLLLLFVTSKGKLWMDTLPLKNLTYLHTIRIPVEIVLFWLFQHKYIPELMTFEGRNFDILAGITAPIIAYFGFTPLKTSKKVLLVWNFICLGLLMNIVINALFSTPTPFQQFAFDQPNIAILYFPISWLPTFIVPIVLFAHVVSIRQLIKEK